MSRKSGRVWAVVAVAAAIAVPVAQADHASPNGSSWSSVRPDPWMVGSVGAPHDWAHGVRPNPWLMGSVGALLARADVRG